MRLLLAVLAAALAACSAGQCKCPDGTACVYVDPNSRPLCLRTCSADGGCGGSTEICQCAATCPACTDCVPVCLTL